MQAILLSLGLLAVIAACNAKDYTKEEKQKIKEEQSKKKGQAVSEDLLQGKGVSCRASTEYPGYPCTETYDGDFSPGKSSAWATIGQNSGAWLKYTFPRKVIVSSIQTWSRCTRVDQFNGAEVVFSDGTKKDMMMACSGGITSKNGELLSNCRNQKADKLTVSGIYTDSIRFNFRRGCQAGGNPGLREVKIFGSYSGDNLLRTQGVTCKSSSHVNGYECERAFDGNYAPGINAAWASDNEFAGGWLEVTFPCEVVVTSVVVWNRCIRIDQYSGAVVDFGNGLTKSMSFTCDGSTTSYNGDLMENCKGQSKNEMSSVGGVRSKTIKFDFEQGCKAGGHAGVREIEILGTYSAGCPKN